jgi:hypothetical protein
VTSLRPFWRYFGGKWRAAPRYPAPAYDTIIEPFAGAAGYSLRYPERQVVLVEKYPTICEMWRYLIAVSPAEVRRIPEVDDVGDLPSWVPQGARSLVGYSMNSACSTPRRTLSAGKRKLRAMHRQYEGWTPALRERVAAQVEHIRHWQIIEGDYTLAPDIAATWFIDPPYQIAGRHYVHSRVDYGALAGWCRDRRGQVLVCEAEGADWAPFRPFATLKAGPNSSGVSYEMLWEIDRRSDGDGRREPSQMALFPGVIEQARDDGGGE